MINVVKPSAELVQPTLCSAKDFYKLIEFAGRMCYGPSSLAKISEDSAVPFIRQRIKDGHEAILEHGPVIGIRFVCDRGVSHEIVRHRLFSFCQESTRYCNYETSGINFVKPCFWEEDSEEYKLWYESCELTAMAYYKLVNPERYGLKKKKKSSPQQARAVLNHSLMTQILVTGNVREWRHFFSLRLSPAAHPQMREVAQLAFDILVDDMTGFPLLFEDLVVEG